MSTGSSNFTAKPAINFLSLFFNASAKCRSFRRGSYLQRLPRAGKLFAEEDFQRFFGRSRLTADAAVLSSGLAGKKFRTGINLRNQRRVKNRREEVGNLKFCGAATPGLCGAGIKKFARNDRAVGPCHKATNSAILCMRPVQSGPATYAPFLGAFSGRS